MDTTTIKNIQNEIGYEFKNARLLEQAFVRKSFAEEHPEFKSNEVLEFYGDRALDLYITTAMYYKFKKSTEDGQFDSEKNEAELTEIKSYNVNTNILSHCIRMFGFQELLCLNESDQKNKVYNSPHVQEDLFEAIIGAVAVDSNWNFERIFNTCKIMLKLADFEMNYIHWLLNWIKDNNYEQPNFDVDLGSDKTKKNSSEQFPLYTYRDYYIDQEKKQNKDWANYTIRKCKLYIKEFDYTFESTLDNLYAAEMDCAKQVYDTVQSRKMNQVAGTPNREDAVNQLNVLHQKGFIDEPYYSFTENHDEDGNPIWQCECDIDELEDVYCGESNVKKEAKKEAAFWALCTLLGYSQAEIESGILDTEQ